MHYLFRLRVPKVPTSMCGATVIRIASRLRSKTIPQTRNEPQWKPHFQRATRSAERFRASRWAC